MTKNASSTAFLSLMLDPSSTIPLYRQLYIAMRQAILSGKLPAGTKLPSTRTFAQTHGISRATVIVAFEQLLYEGYIQGKVGSGTYVEDVLPDELLQVPLQHNTAPAQQSTHSPSHTGLSQRGRAIAASPVAPMINWQQVNLLQTFRHGIPALNEFPFKIWSKLITRRSRDTQSSYFGYTDPAGYYPLRCEIAAYVQAARGVHCTAEQIIIVAGSQQALTLAGHLLLDPGDAAWIEDPCYLGAKGALLSSGVHLVPIPVDSEGLNVAIGISSNPTARLAYVTPSHQFPLGSTMSLARRLALLQWAEHTGAWILEDDYDGEYRYSGHPLASLQGLDTAERVIYIGTFSKVLFPGLRLGYLVAPPALVDAFSATRAAFDRHSHILDQIVLTDFMSEEHFARHVRRMRALYAERREIFIDAIEYELNGLLTVQPNEAGLHLVTRLSDTLHATDATQRAATHEIVVTPLSHYYVQQPPLNALLLGFAAFTEHEIRQGVQKLSQALQQS
jgi:GntR family transcriptional regulator / MocR family aminotransferase